GDQVLLCTAGSGWYQAEGEDPVSMEPGTVIRVPAGTKHWHGAKADSWFSHLACVTPGQDVSNEWLEPVADEVYNELPQSGDIASPYSMKLIRWPTTSGSLNWGWVPGSSMMTKPPRPSVPPWSSDTETSIPPRPMATNVASVRGSA